MRRTPTLLLCACFVTSGFAQLVNGSFELNGQFSTVGWNTTCTPPGEGADGAPNSGNFHATLQPGNFQGCFPQFLYQEIPGAQSGDIYRLSGWVKCDEEEPCLGAYIGIGRMGDQGIVVDDLFGGISTDWMFVEAVDTIEVNDGEMPVVVLSSGNIGGPALLVPAHFDGFQLDLAMSIPEVSLDEIRHMVDQESRNITITAERSGIIDVTLYDLTGRRTFAKAHRSTSLVTLDLNGLPGGSYFAVVRTNLAERTIRFALW